MSDESSRAMNIDDLRKLLDPDACGRFGLDLPHDQWLERVHVALRPSEVEQHRPAGDRPGQLIGPYELLEELGSGGMGTVWRARRADRRTDRFVALKLIRSGMNSQTAIRRFRLEERVLARLEHPNIARLYDGGVARDGRPYFVMEYVEGLPINVYAERNSLTIEDRLSLIQDVCDAVQFAHGSLILHRDIKPGNILITDDGTPKLLDFGISKVLDERDDGAADITVTDTSVLTPQYASPEQIRGETLSVSTDVYSLGVVMYELLAGRSPYDPETGARHELERSILHEEIDRPSSAVLTGDGLPNGPHRAWSRRLRGDIDAICLTALQKSPAARYKSAQQLGEDIRRYLSGMPLLAKPPSLYSRLSKALRRRMGAIVTIVIGAALGIGLAGFYIVQTFLTPGWQDEHIRRARLAIVDDHANTIIYNLLFFNYKGWKAGAVFDQQETPSERRAGLEYSAAFRLGAVSEDVAGEYAMLRLANAVREGADDIETILDDLPFEVPATEAYAKALIRGAAAPESLPVESYSSLSVGDLRCLGLLALLVEDHNTTINSWTRIPMVDADPVVEAILGYIYLALDESELAYARLLSAYRAYPESGTLAVYMADAAIRCGDIAMAEHGLEVAKGQEQKDPHLATERVRLLILLERGDLDEALAFHCRPEFAYKNAVAELQVAKYLERTRGVVPAIGAIAGRIFPRKDHERATIAYYVKLVEAWWAGLDPQARSRLGLGVATGSLTAREVENVLNRYALAVRALEDETGGPTVVVSVLAHEGHWDELAYPLPPIVHEQARAALLALAETMPPQKILPANPRHCTEYE